jgi:hypothetical protein
MIRNASLIAVFLAVSLGGGCAAWKSGSVTHKITVAQHGFLSVITVFQDAEIAEHDKGVSFIPDDVHLKIQTIIQKVALGGKDLDATVAAGGSATTVKAKIDAIYALLDSLQADGLTGVKNASSKAILEIALNQIKSVLDLALTQIAKETSWQPQLSL